MRPQTGRAVAAADARAGGPAVRVVSVGGPYCYHVATALVCPHGRPRYLPFSYPRVQLRAYVCVPLYLCVCVPVCACACVCVSVCFFLCLYLYLCRCLC
jgi:hypothetical protein